MDEHRPAAGHIGLGALHCLFPERLLPVGEVDPEADEDFLRACGAQTVGVIPGLSQGDLAAESCRRLLSADDRPIDVLLHVAGRAPDTLLGSDATKIQHEAKMPARMALTVDGLGCVGSSAAWGLARDLLLADPGRERILVTHGSKPTGRLRVRPPVTVVGDGAFAMTLVRGGRPYLESHALETDGSYHDLFRVDYKRVAWHGWVEECADPARYTFELALESRRRLSGLTERVLQAASVTLQDVKAVLMQNVSVRAFDFYSDLLGVPVHPVCRAMFERYGHLGAMDVVANLDALLKSPDVSTGDRVLVLNNSASAAWSVSLWRV
ncbi:3-oxoacyl-[acyl-carrier-protein] synthase III C-terminal domain-containing protein [Actinomadura sp. ATCC 39365]|uniref:3-oxoacyl-[acyl-carrier-protein] synthase III C-terminal domain-containing protein n=1 Tax=Nonomuraea sp. NPDC005692 TaxID=3157168 RepID=UPI00340B24C4